MTSYKSSTNTNKKPNYKTKTTIKWK